MYYRRHCDCPPHAAYSLTAAADVSGISGKIFGPFGYESPRVFWWRLELSRVGPKDVCASVKHINGRGMKRHNRMPLKSTENLDIWVIWGAESGGLCRRFLTSVFSYDLICQACIKATTHLWDKMASSSLISQISCRETSNPISKPQSRAPAAVVGHNVS